MTIYVLIKDAEIINRKPFESVTVYPRLFLSKHNRWTKDISKARVYTDPCWSVADKFSTRYLYRFVEMQG